MGTPVETYLDYVSGKRRGVGATAVRCLLRAMAAPYYLGCLAREALYDYGVLLCRELDARVLSVGNITAGGTGKTPMVAWLARWLKGRGVRFAILSRGYKPRGERNGDNDEALLLRRHLADVPHLVGKDRFASGLRAIEEHGAECVVLDDGFQHLALGRDLDIVLVDALMPFGYGHVLPRGLLREPLRALSRADLVVLTRCDVCPNEQLRALRRAVRELAGFLPLVEAFHRPVRFYTHGGGEPRPLEWARGRRVVAFSALGNPLAFPATLARLGAEVVHHEAFRDHHWYDDEDLRRIASAAAAAGAEAVVTTEKDAVKIEAFPSDCPPACFLEVEFAVTDGEELLVRALEGMIAR